MHRNSAYFRCESGAFEYPKSNRLVLTNAILDGSVWTEKEREKLQKFVHRHGPHNWEQTSILHKSPMDCYIQYTNLLDPSINASVWISDEDVQLLALVQKYDEHDWCAVAEELGTNRTPFECLRHYQQDLNKNLTNTGDWSVEEDELLKDAVNEHGRNWQVVASCVPNRSSTQCLNRWNKSSICHEEVVAGKWNEEEERLLFLAALAYSAPQHSDSKKTEEQLQQLLTDATGSASAANTSKRYFTHWKEIAALVPGK
jgi:hypothetical protein